MMRGIGDAVVALGTIRALGQVTVWVCRFRDGRLLRLEAHSARDPGRVAWALAQAGLPADSFASPGDPSEAPDLAK